MNQYTGTDWFQAEIDAMRCINRKHMMQEFARAFQFPDSFGWDLDALDDCMTDLSWLPAKNYRLQINNFSQLQAQDPERATYLRDMLGDIETYWEAKSQQVKNTSFQFQVLYP